MSYEDTMEDMADVASENNELKMRVEELEFQVRQERHKGEMNAMVFLEKLNDANALIDRAIKWDRTGDTPKDLYKFILRDMRKYREGK